MKKDKQRTMFYRRATWVKGHEKNLENELKAVHKSLSTTKQRTFPYNQGEIQGLSFEEAADGISIHIASYVPQQATSLVPTPSSDQEKNTATQPPPENHNFMEGDIFVSIRGNHIVLCPSGARESVAVNYINGVLDRGGKTKIVSNLSIEPVANVDKLKIISNEGVKKLSMNASLYEATTDYAERTTTKMTWLNSVAEEVYTLFSSECNHDIKDISELENVSVKLEISFNSRKKGGTVGKEVLGKAATKVISEEDGEGFQIITGGGNKLSATSIRINEKAIFKSHGNSIERVDAWTSLKTYLDSLQKNGALEQ